MKLIVYASKQGTTEECARILAEHFSDAKLINLASEEANVRDYDTVLIGSAIYAGQIRPKVKKFVEDNAEILNEKRVGIFICGGNDENTKSVIENNFKPILSESVVYENFGYQYDFSKLNFFEKLIIKKVANITESKKEIYNERIEEFSKKVR